MGEHCPMCGQSLASNPWRLAREAAGLSNKEAARLSGVSASTISRAEQGKEMYASAAVALARVYGTTVDVLFPLGDKGGPA